MSRRSLLATLPAAVVAAVIPAVAVIHDLMETLANAYVAAHNE